MSSAEPEGLHASASGTNPGPCSLTLEELNSLRVEQLRTCLRIVGQRTTYKLKAELGARLLQHMNRFPDQRESKRAAQLAEEHHASNMQKGISDAHFKQKQQQLQRAAKQAELGAKGGISKTQQRHHISYGKSKHSKGSRDAAGLHSYPHKPASQALPFPSLAQNLPATTQQPSLFQQQQHHPQLQQLQQQQQQGGRSSSGPTAAAAAASWPQLGAATGQQMPLSTEQHTQSTFGTPMLPAPAGPALSFQPPHPPQPQDTPAAPITTSSAAALGTTTPQPAAADVHRAPESHAVGTPAAAAAGAGAIGGSAGTGAGMVASDAAGQQLQDSATPSQHLFDPITPAPTAQVKPAAPTAAVAPKDLPASQGITHHTGLSTQQPTASLSTAAGAAQAQPPNPVSPVTPNYAAANDPAAAAATTAAGPSVTPPVNPAAAAAGFMGSGMYHPMAYGFSPALLAFSLGSPVLSQTCCSGSTAQGLLFRCPCGGTSSSIGGAASSSGGGGGSSHSAAQTSAAAASNQQQGQQQQQEEEVDPPTLAVCSVCGILQHAACFFPQAASGTGSAAAGSSGEAEAGSGASPAFFSHMCDVCRMVAAVAPSGCRLECPLLLAPRLLDSNRIVLGSASAGGAQASSMDQSQQQQQLDLQHMRHVKWFSESFWVTGAYEAVLSSAGGRGSSTVTGFSQQQQQGGTASDIVLGCLRLGAGGTSSSSDNADAGASRMRADGAAAPGSAVDWQDCCISWPNCSSVGVNGKAVQLPGSAAAGSGAAAGAGQAAAAAAASAGLVSIAGVTQLGNNDIVMSCADPDRYVLFVAAVSRAAGGSHPAVFLPFSQQQVQSDPPGFSAMPPPPSGSVPGSGSGPGQQQWPQGGHQQQQGLSQQVAAAAGSPFQQYAAGALGGQWGAGAAGPVLMHPPGTSASTGQPGIVAAAGLPGFALDIPVEAAGPSAHQGEGRGASAAAAGSGGADRPGGAESGGLMQLTDAELDILASALADPMAGAVLPAAAGADVQTAGQVAGPSTLTRLRTTLLPGVPPQLQQWDPTAVRDAGGHVESAEMFNVINSTDSFLNMVQQMPHLMQGYSPGPSGQQQRQQHGEQQNRTNSGASSVGASGASPFAAAAGPMMAERSSNSGDLGDISMQLVSMSLLDPVPTADRIDSGMLFQQLGADEGFWSPRRALGNARSMLGAATPQSRKPTPMDIAEILTSPPASRMTSARRGTIPFSPFWQPRQHAAVALQTGGNGGTGRPSPGRVMGLLGGVVAPSASPAAQQEQEQQQQALQQGQQQYLPLAMLPPVGGSNRGNRSSAGPPSQGAANQGRSQLQQQPAAAAAGTQGGYMMGQYVPWSCGTSNSTGMLLEGTNMDLEGPNMISTGGVLSSAGNLISMADSLGPGWDRMGPWWGQTAGLVPNRVQEAIGELPGGQVGTAGAAAGPGPAAAAAPAGEAESTGVSGVAAAAAAAPGGASSKQGAGSGHKASRTAGTAAAAVAPQQPGMCESEYLQDL